MRSANHAIVNVLKIGLILGLLCVPGATMPGRAAAQTSAYLSGGKLAAQPDDRALSMGSTAHLAHSEVVSIDDRLNAALPAAHVQDTQPYLEKQGRLPDYRQTDPAFGGFPGQGRMYCRPVAVANSIMWLDDHGYDRLVHDMDNHKREEFELILQLGSPEYMVTDPETGTTGIG